jgi:hypothetical protein
MIFFLKRKGKKPSLPQKFIFKDGQSFFEYQCKFGHTEIVPNTGMIALVLNASKEFGVKDPVSFHPDKGQLAVIRVISEDGGFRVFASTPSNKGARLVPGDVVIWVPAIYSDEVGAGMSDRRTGWIGMIRAKVAPEISLADSDFSILCRYD